MCARAPRLPAVAAATFESCPVGGGEVACQACRRSAEEVACGRYRQEECPCCPGGGMPRTRCAAEGMSRHDVEDVRRQVWRCVVRSAGRYRYGQQVASTRFAL